MELDMSITLEYIRISNLCRCILHNPFGSWDKDLIENYWKAKQDKEAIIANINLNQIYN